MVLVYVVRKNDCELYEIYNDIYSCNIFLYKLDMFGKIKIILIVGNELVIILMVLVK